MEHRERQELLLLALDDELSTTQRQSFQHLLKDDPQFEAEWQQLRQIRELAAKNKAESLHPYFSARVMARIREQREQPGLAEGLVRLFRPLVPATLALMLALAVLNWSDRDLVGDEDTTLLESAFGVFPVSVETAEILDL